MTEPPTDAIHGVNRLTRTSCPLSPWCSTLFKKMSTPSDKHPRKDSPPVVGVLCFGKTSKPNSCYWFLYSSKSFTCLIPVFKFYTCVFLVIIHAGSLSFAYRYVFSGLLYIPNSCFWIVCMCFLFFCTYLIHVFELSTCISWFFAHTRFLFLTSAHVFSNILPE